MISKTYTGEVNIVEFTDSEEALNPILEGKTTPDHLFLDVNMPEMDGWEFLEILTEETEKNKLPTIVSMLTSSVFPNDKQKALKYNYVKHLANNPLQRISVSNIFE